MLFFKLALSIVPLVIIYGFTYFVLHYTKSLCIFREMSTKEIVLTIVFAIAAMSLLFAIVSRENYLYSWDSSGYWTRCIATENSFFTNPVKCITSVYTSINRDIYNNLLTLITIFPIKVFTKCRTGIC